MVEFKCKKVYFFTQLFATILHLDAKHGHIDTYKQLNRQVRSAIRRDTREELERRVDRAGPSGLWRSVQPIVAPKRSDRSTPAADADELNRFFVEVGPRTARQVTAAGPELPTRLPRVSTGAFQVTPICPDDLRRVVGRMRSMNPMKSSDGDGDRDLTFSSSGGDGDGDGDLTFSSFTRDRTARSDNGSSSDIDGDDGRSA
ncbi:hypothetical protein FJT64_002176 [Amphibalanus amphitrite]|uniref:Uncharacterized protein n=1 Tax=Amphibalanus amphitrite TaxID=1232801 RepID=A0A6A4X1K1_AMPAM|nr:hypothetical protein FJT64_002176 [Amphibalanus amphitrite]